MHKSQSSFYLTTALHVSGVTITHLQEHKTTVSGVTITHLQEHKTTVTTASGNRYTVLLSAAIVKKFIRLNTACYTQNLSKFLRC
jgi:hypothetical protein